MSGGRGAGGVLLIVAGVWVLAQVLAGHALQRLGIAGSLGDGGLKDPVTAPDKGFNDVPHDGHGYPLN